jgi:hypothetical protein
MYICRMNYIGKITSYIEKPHRMPQYGMVRFSGFEMREKEREN